MELRKLLDGMNARLKTDVFQLNEGDRQIRRIGDWHNRNGRYWTRRLY